jgi:two-component system chemotaxis sensor kinase CheA
MNEFLEQFLIESRELIAQAVTDFLALEQNPADREALDRVFRAVHTLKGGAGIVDFDAMAVLAHALEDELTAVRTGHQSLTRAATDRALAGLDQMSRWLDEIEQQGEVPQGAQPLAQRLAGEIGAAANSVPAAPAGSPAQRDSGLPPQAVALLQAQVEILTLPGGAEMPGRADAALLVMRNVLRRYGFERAFEAAPAVPDSRGAPRAEAPRGARTDMARTDHIVTLAGELSVAKNVFGHYLASHPGSGDSKAFLLALQQSHRQLDRLTAELLRTALAARVLPLRTVFQRFPRLVRDMAASLDKAARLVIEGEETEADKTIVEGLFEPVLHVLRNAIDHGVEPSGLRRQQGKPVPAVVYLRAYRDGEHVIVEVQDDGRGIDEAAVRATAVQRGIVPGTVAPALSRDEVLGLIFAPGFSTAEGVTALSGRGVGMDAVKHAVEQMGGQVELHSRLHEGTRLRFILPFSVVLTRVLTVEAGGQIFGVPFDAAIETIQFGPADVFPVRDRRALLYRDQAIPLLRLAEVLNITPRQTDTPMSTAVVVTFGGEYGAIEVERFGGQMEVMLKPMDGLLSGLRGIAGTSLMGDGRVLIVLEVGELIN